MSIIDDFHAYLIYVGDVNTEIIGIINRHSPNKIF